MKQHILFLLVIVTLCRCEPNPAHQSHSENSVVAPEIEVESKWDFENFFTDNPRFIADGFDFPVGPPDASNYYNAQKFQENFHLGDDWNGIGGGNTDLGDSIYSIAHGYVSSARDEGPGWGNVVRIIHKCPDSNIDFVESLYAHLDTVLVKEGEGVKRGTPIGTMGNADGAYLAHLHLELRSIPKLPLGAGYGADSTGYLNPTNFIKSYRAASSY